MPGRTRPAPLDSGLMPLDGAQRKYVRFDPTLNTGHVLQIVVLIVGGALGFGAIKADQVQTKADIEQVKAVSIVERAQTAQALTEIKQEMKEQGKTLGDLKEGIAILRGRAAEPGGKR